MGRPQGASLLDGGGIYGYNQVKIRYVKEDLDNAT